MAITAKNIEKSNKERYTICRKGHVLVLIKLEIQFPTHRMYNMKALFILFSFSEKNR
jgi:hypothetical protein